MEKKIQKTNTKMKNLSKKALIKEFNEFLRENDCASKFYVNKTVYAPEERTSTFFKECMVETWISRAFIWDRSPENQCYWSNKCKIWKERLKAIKYTVEKSKSK